MVKCNCPEGRFERTKENFAGRSLHPFAATFLAAKVGATCQAPPVHDCEYIRTRNALSAQARQLAWEDVKAMREGRVRDEMWDARTRELTDRLVREHYLRRPVG